MSRVVLLSVASVIALGFLVAAPVPSEPAAKTLVAGLSDPSAKVRDEAAAALKNRVDALPWLRRAARAADEDTSRRAAGLLSPHEKKRQEIVAKAIDACVRDGRVDLFMEWHHFWQPANKEDLWPIGPQAAKAGMDLYAKSCPPTETKRFEETLAGTQKKIFIYDGPRAELERTIGRAGISGTGYLRTDRWDRTLNNFHFASVAGPVDLNLAGMECARCFALGSVRALGRFAFLWMFVACDGDVDGGGISSSVVVCRGDLRAAGVAVSVLLVDGDIDLTSAEENRIKGSVIRASGEIRLPKDKDAQPVNCTIEAHAKDATAPYKFFELADVGLSLADDEEGLVVIAVKAGTPFGNCGLAKGDLIRAIDDVPAGNSEEFRKKVRKALVRQGDCLVTVVRGDKTIDLPVFFPLPK